MKSKIKKLVLVLVSSSLLLVGSFNKPETEHKAAVVSSTVIAAAVAALTVAVGGSIMFPGVTDNVRNGIGNAANSIWNQLNKTMPLTDQEKINNDLLQGVLTQNSLSILLNSYKDKLGNSTQETTFDPVSGDYTYKQINNAFSMYTNESTGLTQFTSAYISSVMPQFTGWTINNGNRLQDNVHSFEIISGLSSAESAALTYEFVNISASSIGAYNSSYKNGYAANSTSTLTLVSADTPIVAVRVSNLPERYTSSGAIHILADLWGNFNGTTIYPPINNGVIDIPLTIRAAVPGIYGALVMPEVIYSTMIPQGTVSIDAPTYPSQEQINQNIRDMIIQSGVMAGSIAIPQNPTFPNADTKDRVVNPGDIATPEEWTAAKSRVGDLTPDDIIIGGVIGSLLLPFPEFPDLTNNFPDTWSIGEMFKGLFTGLGDIFGWLGAIISTGFINLTNLLKSVPLILADIFSWLKSLTMSQTLVNILTKLKEIALKIGGAVAVPLDFIFTIPQDISLDFKPLQALIPIDKFPFSIPWDYANIINSFKAEPQAPRWELELKGEIMVVDFDDFSTFASISRNFLSAIFLVGLMFATRKLIQGGN